ncbi:MAG: Hsp20/alpha crystallin family protein [bacterium]|jgi:HSP20 family protein|nr:Hsp20/alpha crystallin family protein [Planctomycetota bacterium]HIL52340.1 Hsp20/alpha crystallin family protein [Planctomycetota bacterium]
MTILMPKRVRLRSLLDSNPIEQWLNSAFETEANMPTHAGDWGTPRADIRETDGEYIISVELAGLMENEIEVKITDDQLIVSGEKVLSKERDDEHYHRVERHYGAFERCFDLPPRVRTDAGCIKAVFDRGVLDIRVPKTEPRPVAKIPISFT